MSDFRIIFFAESEKVSVKQNFILFEFSSFFKSILYFVIFMIRAIANLLKGFTGQPCVQSKTENIILKKNL